MDIKPIETKYKGYRFRSKVRPIPARKRISGRADYSRRRFGRCVAVECLGLAGSGFRWWGCQCDCGEKFAARSRELARGHTRSCGCLQREVAAQNGGHNRLPVGMASRNELLASYIKSASGRGIEWSLSPDEFLQIVTQPCSYCATPPDRWRKPNAGVNGGFMYSGIDRVDNAIGYVTGNVTPCCWYCNRAKATMPLGDFVSWLDRIVRNRSKFIECA